jgi:Fe2+ transport system protein B
MMRNFGLTKDELVERDRLAEALEKARLALVDAIATYNAKLEEEIKVPVVDAIAAYGDALTEAKEFAETIVSDAESDIDDKSERWQESERGEQAVGFKDRWQEIVNTLGEELDIELPGEIDDPDSSQSEEFAASPNSMDEV